MTEHRTEEITDTLSEQRIHVAVRPGGRGSVHVFEYRTDPAWSHPGRWTRRAASRQSFCGKFGALMVGIDAAEWPTERIAPEHLGAVTCQRCSDRAARLFRPVSEREGDE